MSDTIHTRNQPNLMSPISKPSKQHGQKAVVPSLTHLHDTPACFSYSPIWQKLRPMQLRQGRVPLRGNIATRPATLTTLAWVGYKHSKECMLHNISIVATADRFPLPRLCRGAKQVCLQSPKNSLRRRLLKVLGPILGREVEERATISANPHSLRINA